MWRPVIPKAEVLTTHARGGGGGSRAWRRIRCRKGGGWFWRNSARRWSATWSAPADGSARGETAGRGAAAVLLAMRVQVERATSQPPAVDEQHRAACDEEGADARVFLLRAGSALVAARRQRGSRAETASPNRQRAGCSGAVPHDAFDGGVVQL